MRDVKFRAWDTENNCYWKNNFEGLFLCMSGSLLLRTHEKIIPESMFPNRFIKEFYTGFTDKKGKEIYEGDIVEFDDIFDEVYEIKHCRAGYDLILAFHPISKNEEHYNHYYGSWDGSECEVIGNIHKNPELLTEGKKEE